MTLFKALIVFVITAVVGCVASFLYGIIAHFFDLFIVFPFLVAGVIVGTGSTVAKWVRLNQGTLLVLIGLFIGALAYPTYLSGKYAMLVTAFAHGSPDQLVNFSFEPDTLASLQTLTSDAFESARERTDVALQQYVGQGGIAGQMLLNMRAGIPIRTHQLGENNVLFGGLIELFKAGVLVAISGSSLRETVKAQALWGGRRGERSAQRRLSAEEEELWGKGE